MLNKDTISKIIKDFRKENAVDARDENMIATVHLMNAHRLSKDKALDQSSRASNDHGVDAWFLDGKSGELIVYQSKFSEAKTGVLGGLTDLQRAREWLEGAVIDRQLETVPDNHCLYSLHLALSRNDSALRKISFVLLSLFDRNELLDRDEVTQAEKELRRSRLFEWMSARKGRIDLRCETYSLETGISDEPERYTVKRFPDSRVKMRATASLDLGYVSLHSLVELYRQRGEALFHKNVRLSVVSTKETRARLAHPMEQTLEAICNGKIAAEIIPFYHVGVTLRAAANELLDQELSLEAPTVINGCQTITIASSFLKELQRKRAVGAIEKFKEIQVVAKIVTGTSDDELREITNSNNRQIPIENWQLFSNEPIHIEIEHALQAVGVFYERQAGRFEAVMRKADGARKFPNTNNARVTVEELGQIVCLSRGNIQWAAKRSEIFLNRKNHDSVFDLNVPRHPHDIVFVSNLFKALKCGLQKYLQIPSYDDELSASIFKKPTVRASLFYLGCGYFYQSPKKDDIRRRFGSRLNKIAPNSLVDECQSFYQKVVSKMKQWYLKESKQLEIEVAASRLAEFTDQLADDVGISIENGAGPFSEASLADDAWSLEEIET